jgi:hypothetical protein
VSGAGELPESSIQALSSEPSTIIGAKRIPVRARASGANIAFSLSFLDYQRKLTLHRLHEQPVILALMGIFGWHKEKPKDSIK